MRKRSNPNLPNWAMPAKDLHKWERMGGILLFGQTVQVLFRDNGTPLAVALLRPVALNKDAGATLGTFLMMNQQDEPDRFRKFVVGPYYACLQAFVVDAEPELAGWLIRHPREVQYLDLPERERLQEILQKREMSEVFFRRGKLKPLELQEHEQQPVLGGFTREA